MKKLLILTLALVMMISSFAACNKAGKNGENNDEKNDEPTEITFTHYDMSITLPSDFEEDLRRDGCYSNEDYAVRSYAVPKSSITPNEGQEFPSLKTFITMSGIVKAENIDFKDNGDYLSTDYVTTSDNIINIFSVKNDGDKQFMIFFETDRYFWFMSFYSSTVEYDQVKTQAAAWIDTIEISAKEA